MSLWTTSRNVRDYARICLWIICVYLSEPLVAENEGCRTTEVVRHRVLQRVHADALWESYASSAATSTVVGNCTWLWMFVITMC